MNNEPRQPHDDTMHAWTIFSRMGFHSIALALLCKALLIPAAALQAEPLNQGEAVVRLLNLFASRTDALAVANAGKRLNQDASPLAALAADPHAPMASLGGWNSPETTRSLASRLGEYVFKHPGEFPGGLPSPSSIQDPLRLEAFFEGMYQPTLGASASASFFQRDLARLSLLLDDSWLDAAASCGALNLQHLLFAHRGKLPRLLRSYQDLNDEIALIILGESLAGYSEAFKQIEPRDFQPRTLALLLAGSLGAPDSAPDETRAIVATALEWEVSHPGLIGLLQELGNPASLTELNLRIATERESR